MKKDLIVILFRIKKNSSIITAHSGKNVIRIGCAITAKYKINKERINKRAECFCLDLIYVKKNIFIIDIARYEGILKDQSVV